MVAGSERWRGGAAAGGRRGRQQVQPDELLQHLHIGLGEPEPGRDAADDLDAGVGVVAGEALPDVVQQRADEQQVGPAHGARQRGGVGGRFPQVPVDGEAVVGVALGLVLHRLPLGQELHQQPVLVERLEHRDGVVAGAQQGDEVLPPVLGPDLGRVDGVDRHRRQRGRRQRHTRLRRLDRRRQPMAGIVRHDHPLRARPRAAEPRVDAVPRVVRDVGDRSGGGAHVGHQRVGIGELEVDGDAVLLLQHQPVHGPADPLVQGGPDAGDAVVRLSDGVDPFGQHRRRQPGGEQRVDVAQPAPPFLQLRLEQVRDLAEAGVAFDERVVQHPQPPLGLGAPLLACPGRQLVRHRPVAGDVAGVEHAEHRLQVGVGDRQRLLDGADGVVEADAPVPDRVPDLVGELLDLRRLALPVVHQQEIEVREGCGVAPSIGPDRDEADAPLVAEQRRQPVVVVRGGFRRRRRPSPRCGCGRCGRRR
jgi:hypothetical protein